MSGTKWKFDETVTLEFEDMLKRSIPQYNVMRKLCFDLACHYIIQKTCVIDLGSSRGDSIEMLFKKYNKQNFWILTEISEPMLKVLRNRFRKAVREKIMDIVSLDLSEHFPPAYASVIQSILTIQFIPIECRQNLIQSIYDHLIKNGVFIFVEKVLGYNAEIDTIMVKEYYKLKSKNKYTDDEIRRKQLSLRGVLVPVTAKWNEELLYQAGFKKVDCFWRWMNFSGWIAIK